MLRTEKECIEYIHSAGRFGKKAGLCNIKALLDILGNPQRDLKCIHVAGTNGKGSVSCMISNILCAKGYKVGLNTSPYIEVFNERLSICGEFISADKLIYYTNLVADAIRKLNNIKPIEFEIITAIGFLYFKDEKCDYAVIECGIGGLYDSTNVIENPTLCVICSLDFDHTEILGDTIEDIAYQKAGIIKDNSKTVVHPLVCDEAFKVIEKTATEKNSHLFKAEDNFEVIKEDLTGTCAVIDGIEINLSLLGTYQISNAALCVKCARVLGIEDTYIKQGIESARWKCRFELVGYNTIIDGAHNYQGVCSFCQSVEKYIPGENRVFIIGMLNDKDFNKSAKELSNLKGEFIVTDVPSTRQTDGKSVYECIKNYIPSAKYIPNYEEAYTYARIRGGEGFVCIAGSLYLAGALRTFINKNSHFPSKEK